MNPIKRLVAFMLLFASPWLVKAQVQVDTTFKGSAAIAAHLHDGGVDGRALVGGL